MCGPGLVEAFDHALKRREILFGGALAAAALMSPAAARAQATPARRSFASVIDLSHPLDADFPTYFGQPGFKMEPLFAFARSGFNLMKLEINEHTGTHIDAPLHFTADGLSIDAVAAENLVAPLAVIDLRSRVQRDEDYLVSIDDIRAYEAQHGAVPVGACIAINTGWAERLGTPRFRNADAGGTMHFPGFHVDTIDWLLRERNINGIGIDTLSFDHGPSKDFKAHYRWLPAGKWAAENLANLDRVPPSGATIVAGAPRYKGGTGCPTRFLALV